MDSMNLKDFRSDNPDLDAEDKTLKQTDSEIPASMYHEEINTLKIDKLSNRVTIISIIIPCLIGVILLYAYLDMKKRMNDVDLTKQTQVEKLSQQLEEKLNALDVKIAKNRYDLDNQLPGLNKKTVALEGKILKLDGTKADSKIIKGQLIKLDKRVANNANQNKTLVQTIERINRQTLLAIKENQNQFNKTAKQIKDEINLFKEEFDARLLELSDYEQQIGELRKDFSLLDKKYKRLEQDSISQTSFDKKINQLKTDLNYQLKSLDKQVDLVNQKLVTNVSRLQKDLDFLMESSSSKNSKANIPTDTKPKPQINIDSSDAVTIEEEPLTR
jgi:chromosome segregation ATPase